jgi:hypothetical protein
MSAVSSKEVIRGESLTIIKEEGSEATQLRLEDVRTRLWKKQATCLLAPFRFGFIHPIYLFALPFGAIFRFGSTHVCQCPIKFSHGSSFDLVAVQL